MILNSIGNESFKSICKKKKKMFVDTLITDVEVHFFFFLKIKKKKKTD